MKKLLCVPMRIESDREALTVVLLTGKTFWLSCVDVDGCFSRRMGIALADSAVSPMPKKELTEEHSFLSGGWLGRGA